MPGLLPPIDAMLIDESTAFLAGTARRGDAPFAEISWAEQPHGRIIARVTRGAPLHKGYGHLLCAGLSKSGKVTGCRTEDAKHRLGGAPEPRFESAALRLVGYFRADAQWIARRKEIKFITIYFQFRAGGPEGDSPGDCEPFCVIEPMPPARQQPPLLK
jgi:hypothetical protein